MKRREGILVLLAFICATSVWATLLTPPPPVPRTDSQAAVNITITVLPFSSYEPSFAEVVMTVGRKLYVLYGGLWAVANKSRTIDAEPSPWAPKDPTIVRHEEVEWDEGNKHYAYCMTEWAWGKREVVFMAEKGVPYIVMNVTWTFYNSVYFEHLCDPYWEQIDRYSVKYDEYVVFEGADGKLYNISYWSLRPTEGGNISTRTARAGPVGRWLWLSYTRCGLPVGFYFLYQKGEPVAYIADFHGNDVKIDWAEGRRFSGKFSFTVIIIPGMELDEFREFVEGLPHGDP
ncbi:MAG: hypothetical protein DRO09_02220 [Thermoprotei archaeon]|nr:MAG: hypothetical protein DRO09_02220 [Thermoprotei archaeon]